MRYTVERATLNIRRVRPWSVFRPGALPSGDVAGLLDSFGCLPRRWPFALATCIPSRVLARMRPDSNSATIARTLNSRRPTGSVGSWTDPPMLSLTPLMVSSSTMSLASRRERASRSSLATTSVLPFRQAARASRRPSCSVGAGESVVGVDQVDLTPRVSRALCWAVRSSRSWIRVRIRS